MMVLMSKSHPSLRTLKKTQKNKQNTKHKKSHNLQTPPMPKKEGKHKNTKNAYSPNALITSNRIPAKADPQSPSHATLRLGAPLLFPAHFRRSRGLESLPAVFG